MTISNERGEQIFDALLKTAAEEALRREMDDMPSCEELDKLYAPSAEMDKKINNMIGRRTAARQIKKAAITFGKAAAVLCVVLVVSAAALMSVEASRNYIFNAVIHWGEKSAFIRFTADDTQSKWYKLGYVPEGFSLQDEVVNDVAKVSFYSDENGTDIVFQQMAAEASNLQVDNERKDYKPVMINGKEAYLFEDKNVDDANILVWNERSIAFMLSATLDPDLLIEIAENVEK